MDGRTQRRLKAMLRVQAAALDLFEQRGVEAVTIEDIAREAESSPASVYRNFGTKEGIVLWDPYDPMLLGAIAERLGNRPALQAIEEGFAASMNEVYTRDRARILRRSRLMFAQPNLLAAASAGSARLRVELSRLLIRKRACPEAFEARVLASAVLGAMEVAVEEWVRLNGKPSLREVLSKAFVRLRRSIAG